MYRLSDTRKRQRNKSYMGSKDKRKTVTDTAYPPHPFLLNPSLPCIQGLYKLVIPVLYSIYEGFCPLELQYYIVDW